WAAARTVRGGVPQMGIDQRKRDRPPVEFRETGLPCICVPRDSRGSAERTAPTDRIRVSRWRQDNSAASRRTEQDRRGAVGPPHARPARGQGAAKTPHRRGSHGAGEGAFRPLSRREGGAPQRALGGKSAAPLRIVQARSGNEPPFPPDSRHAGMGRGLCDHARAGAPARARSRPALLEARGTLPPCRAGPRFSGGIFHGRQRRSGGILTAPAAGPEADAPGEPVSRGATVRRVAGVLIRPETAAAAPPGVDPDAFLAAVAEDTYEVVAGLELVQPVI